MNTTQLSKFVQGIHLLSPKVIVFAQRVGDKIVIMTEWGIKYGLNNYDTYIFQSLTDLGWKQEGEWQWCFALVQDTATAELVGWSQAVLTALNVGDVRKNSPLHHKLREVMITYRASKGE